MLLQYDWIFWSKVHVSCSTINDNPYVCLYLFWLCELGVVTELNITSSIFEPCGHKGALALCEEPNLPALRVSSSNRLIGVYFDVLPITLVSCYPRVVSISMRRLRLNQSCVSGYPLCTVNFRWLWHMVVLNPFVVAYTFSALYPAKMGVQHTYQQCTISINGWVR